MRKYELVPIQIAENHMPKAVLTRNIDDDVMIHFPICIYYIRGPKENIIIDSGKIDRWPAYLEEAVRYMYPDRQFKPRGETVRGSWPAVLEGLGKLGLTPEDIDIVLVSHIHHEHMGYVKEYPNARFIIQKDDVEYGLNPLPYHRDVFLPEKIWELQRHPGLEVIDGDREIVPGVAVMKCPGHTPGLQAVLIETAEGVAVYGSDLINMYHNIFPNDPELGTPQPYTDFIPPWYMTDLEDCYRSFHKMRDAGDYIIPGHEPRMLVGMGNIGKIPPRPYVPKNEKRRKGRAR